MKTILLTTIIWALTAIACYGQVEAVEVGSAEAYRLMQQQMQNLGSPAQPADATAEKAKRHKEFLKAVEAGRSLFGDDPRWTASCATPAAGTLVGKPPTDFKIGDWGCTLTVFQVIGKVSGSEFLVAPKYQAAEALLVRGLDTSKVTDGVEFVLQHPIVIQATYSYTAVSGALKTVLVLDCHHPELDAKIARATEDARFLTWRVGRDEIRGKFIDFTKGKVRLERKDDHKIIEVPIYRFSKSDQKYIRAESQRVAGAPIGTKRNQPVAKTVAAVAGNTADGPKENSSPDRVSSDDSEALTTRWLNESYNLTLRRVKDKEWAEFDNKTGRLHLQYTETGRNKEHLELYCAERNQNLRIAFGGKRMELRKNGKWEWVANGHWETSAK